MGRFILIAGLCLVVASVASAFEFLCYIDVNSPSRDSDWNFDTSTHLAGTPCTHMVVAYADIDSNDLATQSLSDFTFYSSVTDLKTSNPDLKVLLAVGGPGFDVNKFSSVASDENRAIFSSNVVTFLRDNSFDGLMLDWRYPDDTGDKEMFTALCQDLSDTFENEDSASDTLLLAAAVCGHRDHMEASYEISELDNHLDLIHILAHDYYDLDTGVTRHHSPLKPGSLDTAEFASWNAMYTMFYWRNMGASPEKLLLGVAAYGRSFTLSGQLSHIGASVSGAGDPGDYTNEAGFLSYFEICSSTTLEEQYSEAQGVYYAVGGNQWVGYDNPDSVSEKATFVINYSFGGVAVMSLDLDDFRGQCPSEVVYPLVNQLSTILEAGTATITFSSGSGCPPEDIYGGCVGRMTGQYSVPDHPTCFFNCWEERTYLQSCWGGQVFNEECSCCDHGGDLDEDTSGSGIQENFCATRDDGVYAIIDEPTKFYQCSHRITYIMECGPNTVFDQSCSCCDWA